MLATIAVPLVAAIIGALVFALASNDKAAQLGKMLCFCGLFWLIAETAHASMRFGVP